MDYRCMPTEALLLVLLSFAPTPREPRVDDMRITSGIIYVFLYGLPWREAPPEYSSYSTLYSHWSRWSQRGCSFSCRRFRQHRARIPTR